MQEIITAMDRAVNELNARYFAHEMTPESYHAIMRDMSDAYLLILRKDN